MDWVKRQIIFHQPALQPRFSTTYTKWNVPPTGCNVWKGRLKAIAAAPGGDPASRASFAVAAWSGKIVAVSLVAEVDSLSRFSKPRQLISYAGLVSSEYSSGHRIQRGGITKTGNSHLRRVIVETAWAYLSTQTLDWRLAGQAATRAGQRNQSHGLKSAAAAVHPL